MCLMQQKSGPRPAPLPPPKEGHPAPPHLGPQRLSQQTPLGTFSVPTVPSLHTETVARESQDDGETCRREDRFGCAVTFSTVLRVIIAWAVGPNNGFEVTVSARSIRNSSDEHS